MPSTPGERLKRAIKLAGYNKIAHFAEVAGIPAGTIRQQIDRDSIPKEAAGIYVRKLRRVGVRLEWLMYGRGPGPGEEVMPDIMPDDGGWPTVPIRHYVGAGDEVHLFGEDEPRIGDTAAPPGFEHGSAVIVRGSSMRPTFIPGDMLFFKSRDDPPRPTDLPKRAVIVEVTDGPLFLKKILPGTAPGLFHLISVNPTTPDMLDRRIQSIARIGWIRPADE